MVCGYGVWIGRACPAAAASKIGLRQSPPWTQLVATAPLASITRSKDTYPLEAALHAHLWTVLHLSPIISATLNSRSMAERARESPITANASHRKIGWADAVGWD